MSFKHIIAAVALMLGSIASSNAALITTTTTGVIHTGWDYFNTFGAGYNIAGRAFEMSMTVDTAQNTTSQTPLSVVNMGTAPFSVSMTVNNITFSQQFTASISSVAIVNGDTDLGYAPYSMNAANLGSNATGGGIVHGPLTVEGYQYLASQSSFFAGTPLLGESYAHIAQGDDFGVTQLTLQSGFGNVLSITAYTQEMRVQEQVQQELPEPSMIGLFVIGMLGLALPSIGRRVRPRIT